MPISKKSIIGGLGLALSLASGLAQAGQVCSKSQYFNSYTALCQFDINSVPGTRTITFNVDARYDDFRGGISANPVVTSALLRGQTTVATWRDTFTAFPKYRELKKSYSYKKGGLGQYNYKLNVLMRGEANAFSFLSVTTNR